MTESATTAKRSAAYLWNSRLRAKLGTKFSVPRGIKGQTRFISKGAAAARP
jgi:hypothetical protein